MPNIEPVVLSGDRFTLRHIGPRAAVWPNSPATNITVLARTDMVARPLPASGITDSPDFVSGSWTGRLNDAGECTLIFPNKEASDGVPWRQRFSPAGHLQFIEIYDNGLLDFCGVIDTVQVDQQQVQVHCQDGWFLLKKAYERDWIVVESPRDAIERGTQVSTPTVADSFPASSRITGSTLTTPFESWLVVTSGAGGVSVGAGGGVSLSQSGSSAASASIGVALVAIPSGTQTWDAECTVQYLAIPPGGNFGLVITESDGSAYTAILYEGVAQLNIGGTIYAQTTLASAASYTLTLESDGEWVWAFCNGALIGVVRRVSASTTSLTAELSMQQSGGTATNATAYVTEALVRVLRPFLMRGTDKGDYVLPGVSSTYPSGGLAARYYNDADLAGDTNRLAKILNPTRSQAYAGSGPQEYADQQDPTVNGQANPTPGASTSNWSAKWFGAIYLKLSAGNYVLAGSVPGPGTAALRIWIGNTVFGTQLLDEWAWNTANAWQFTVSASALVGTLSYAAGTVPRDGWYPIKIEYAVDSTAQGAPQLVFKNVPASYTDPGGTAISSGVQTTVVPATSLSPLGCIDQRYQGVSHFDLVQQTLQAVGYQASVEPQQLESGLFPGVLAPRLREGHDTDIALEPDIGPRTDGEGLLNYSNTIDATDIAASLQGNGAGFQNGTAGQLQSLGFDPATLLASLFDLRGWQDFSDASLPALLQALLNSALGLKLAPWQNLSADPTGRPRLAFTWPLPGNLAAMRWRPGDGLRIHARDINVWDTSPRQILVFTRNFVPNGTTGATATYANRPITQARALKQQLYTATRLQRNYQKQLVTLTGNYVSGTIAYGVTGANSIVALQPTDRVVRASLRITVNSAAVSFGVIVNNNPVTSILNGPWTTVPINLPLNAVAAVSSSNGLQVAVKNTDTRATPLPSDIEYQLLVDVLR